MNTVMKQLQDVVDSSRIAAASPLEDAVPPGHDRRPLLEPRCTVTPQDVDEVQRLVQWANRTGTPLIPASSGPPHLRADTVPSTAETVMVDLRGMNRIRKIDRRYRLAVIEPGVTFGQLQSALAEHEMRIIPPLLPRRNKSVLAALLEREPGISPRYHWNMNEPLRSLEIVWGNGDKLYTGGGMNRSLSDEDWKDGRVPLVGPGPAQTDYYKFVSAAQGTMGIVTWASVKCEVLPYTRSLFFVSGNDLQPLIEFTYRLLKYRFGDELFIVNDASLAFLLAQDSQEVETLKSKAPAWTVVVGVTGGQVRSQERREAREHDIADIAQTSGLELRPTVADRRGGEVMELLQYPSADPYWKLKAKGDVKEVFFLSTLNRTSRFITSMYEQAAEHRWPVSDIGVYLQPVHQGVGCHCEFLIPFDGNTRSSVSRAEDLADSTARRLYREGAYFSRPYGRWAEMVYNGDAHTTIIMRKIKNLFDPNNVMNPGKLCF